MRTTSSAAVLLLAMFAMAGCDLYQEDEPLPGSYVATRFERIAATAPEAPVARDVMASGGTVELSLTQNGENRAFQGRVVIPEAALLPGETEPIDLAVSGTYFFIVDRVTLHFDQENVPLPRQWSYRDGTLSVDVSSVSLELSKR